MNITHKQFMALEGIVKSDYHDGANPIGNHVWSFSCNPFGEGEQKAFGGVVTSLVKQGFVVRSRTRNRINGRERWETTLAVTVTGFKAYLDALGEAASVLPVRRAEAEMSDDRFYTNGSRKTWDAMAAQLEAEIREAARHLSWH